MVTRDTSTTIAPTSSMIDSISAIFLRWGFG
jgi:hypothetical protein